jgi:hypothetical protein
MATFNNNIIQLFYFDGNKPAESINFYIKSLFSFSRVFFGHLVYVSSYPETSNQPCIWPHVTLVCIDQFFYGYFIQTEFIVLATILGLTLRSGDKTSLQLVLFSLVLYHALSFLSKLCYFR